MKKIALLGPGTFSEEAVLAFFKDAPNEYIHHKLISDVFLSTASGSADLGVIPIENTLEGSVQLHMDWLVHEVDLPIHAEWVYPIQMNLIGYPVDGSTSYAHIQKIYTHQVVSAQCRQFLREHLSHAEIETTSTTAEGVRLVKEAKDPSVAAIGTSIAAALYGLPVLVPGIQDHQNNMTKFVLIGKEAPELRPSDVKKTTILITLPEDYPGALHQVLSAFAWRRINLSKIESRPTKKKLGNYYFYIDIEGSLESVLLQNAIQEIEVIGCSVRILGSYPSYSHEFMPKED